MYIIRVLYFRHTSMQLLFHNFMNHLQKMNNFTFKKKSTEKWEHDLKTKILAQKMSDTILLSYLSCYGTFQQLTNNTIIIQI